MQLFSCEYCKNFKNGYFDKHLQMAAFDKFDCLIPSSFLETLTHFILFFPELQS